MSAIQSRFRWASHEMLGVAVYAAQTLFNIEIEALVEDEDKNRQYEYTFSAMFTTYDAESETETLNFVFQDKPGNQFIVCIDPADGTFWESGGQQAFQAPLGAIALLTEDEEDDDIPTFNAADEVLCEVTNKATYLVESPSGLGKYCEECGEEESFHGFWSTHVKCTT